MRITDKGRDRDRAQGRAPVCTVPGKIHARSLPHHPPFSEQESRQRGKTCCRLRPSHPFFQAGRTMKRGTEWGKMRCGELTGATGSRSLGTRAEHWWYLGLQAVCPAHSVFISWAVPVHRLAELDGMMFEEGGCPPHQLGHLCGGW